TDSAHGIEVSVVPSIGNIAYEIKVHGKNVLWFPYASVADFKNKPQLCAVPFLAPWANRLDQFGFWANGKKYLLNKDLGNVRPDSNGNPIHGLLSYSRLWRVTEVKADGDSAHVASKPVFWKQPGMMAPAPFRD